MTYGLLKMKYRNLGIRHWVRVFILLAITIFLTWFGKHKPITPQVSRHHGLVGWFIPSEKQFSALFVLPDDGDDSNAYQTGLRIWVHPPHNPLQWEKEQHALYRGLSMVLIGDSLDSITVTEAASMVDTGGHLILIGQQKLSPANLQKTAPHLQIQQKDPSPQTWDWFHALQGKETETHLTFETEHVDPLHLSIQWNGYKIRLWHSSEEMLKDSDWQNSKDSLSLGIVQTCLNSDNFLPGATSAQIRSLIYCGTSQPALDSTRIHIPSEGFAGVMAEDNTHHRLLVKAIHLQKPLSKVK